MAAKSRHQLPARSSGTAKTCRASQGARTRPLASLSPMTSAGRSTQRELRRTARRQRGHKSASNCTLPKISNCDETSADSGTVGYRCGQRWRAASTPERLARLGFRRRNERRVVRRNGKHSVRKQSRCTFDGAGSVRPATKPSAASLGASIASGRSSWVATVCHAQAPRRCTTARTLHGVLELHSNDAVPQGPARALRSDERPGGSACSRSALRGSGMDGLDN